MTDSRETQRLRDLENAPAPKRLLIYARLMGPGYMQSAMTLGGGTAFASIFAGAAFGYDLLWVAPLSMLLGIIVLSAVAFQTLSTGEDPFDAMRRHAGAVFAYGWAIGAILSSIIWQFAQYALAAAMLELLARNLGLPAPRWAMGGVALVWCVSIGLLYNRSTRLVRTYEAILKTMVWLIVISFAIVVVKTGVPEPGRLLAGYVPSIPEPAEVIDAAGAPREPIKATFVIVSGLAAAVGVNMLFIYPYSLRRRGWGRAHRRLAWYDLVFGMFVPYTIAASLILIAAASALHFGDPSLFEGRKISPAAVAQILAAPDRLGPTAGLWIFSLGVIAMALSSITMQMLSSGFAFTKLFGGEIGGKRHTFGTLLPAIGVLGAFFWTKIAVWVAVPTNIVCGLLMPMAYVGFIILQSRRSYLGDDAPSAWRNRLWIGGMLIATLVLTGGLVKVLIDEAPAYVDRISSALSPSESP